MYEIVQCKNKKYLNMSEECIFKELDKVVACQMHLDVETDAVDSMKAFENRPDKEQSGQIHILTGVPMIDIVINIDWFTAHFEDRNKVLTIVQSPGTVPLRRCLPNKV